MADGTIDSELIVLYDNWPGRARDTFVVPTDGFTGSTHHNVATAVYDVGTKVQVYNDSGTAGKAGFATFIYLQFQADTTVMAAKQLAVPASATIWYQVTNDPDNATLVAIAGGLAAVCLSAMTDTYYGWFWCGGVCPESFVSGLGGNFACVDALTAGAFMAADLTADAIGITVPAAATDVAIGYTLAAAS